MPSEASIDVPDSKREKKGGLDIESIVRRILPKVIEGQVVCSDFSLTAQTKGWLLHDYWERTQGDSSKATSMMQAIIRESGPTAQLVVLKHKAEMLGRSPDMTEETAVLSPESTPLTHRGELFVLRETGRIRIGIHGYQQHTQHQFMVVDFHLPDVYADTMMTLLKQNPVKTLTSAIDPGLKTAFGRILPADSGRPNPVEAIMKPIDKGATIVDLIRSQ